MTQSDQYDGEQIMVFPQAFAVKIMGRNEDTFVAHAIDLVTQHTVEAAPLRVDSRASKNQRFISVTVEITATSRDQLDAIYQSLTDDERVVMAL